jgi:outer membrane immunogenic protein
MKSVGKMKKLVLGAAILLAGVGSAAAADLGMPVKAPPPPPLWTWTGFYTGLNLGWGWNNGTNSATLLSPAGVVTGVATTGAHNGFVGGGQVGYNWQTGPFVLGVEGDFDGSAIKSTDGIGCFGAAVLGCSLNATTGPSWIATARARVGYAFDRWLIYATGGGAWERVSGNLTIIQPPGGLLGVVSTTFSNQTTRSGWVVGGGVETAFWDHFIFGLEYLYINTGTWTSTPVVVGAGSPFLTIPGAVVGSSVVTSVNGNTNVVRARFSYKF